MADPKRYGFVIDEEYLYRPFEYKKVEVEGPIANWSDFAAEHKTNFKLARSSIHGFVQTTWRINKRTSL